MPDSQQPLLHSIWDAADRLGISESTVWRLIRQGKLRATRLRGRTLLSEAELQRIAGTVAEKPPSAGERAVRSEDVGSVEQLQNVSDGGSDDNKCK